VLALILFLLTVPALALVVNRPSERGLYPDGADGPVTAARTAEPAPALSTREIVTDPSFWLVGAVVTTVMAGMFGMVTNVVPMARDLGIGAREAALIVSVYAVTGWCAKLGFAAFGDRFNPRHMMFFVLGLLAAGMACLSRASTGYSVIMIGSGLIGIGGMMLPLQSFVIPRIFGPAVVGRAAGLLSLVTLAGMLVMPPIFGMIYDKTGSYAAIFLIFAAVAVLMMLAVPKIRLHPRGTAPEQPTGPLVAARAEL
jgi:MFS family permease